MAARVSGDRDCAVQLDAGAEVAGPQAGFICSQRQLIKWRSRSAPWWRGPDGWPGFGGAASGSTFARLSQILHQAASSGRPYNVVHFDGHGTYLDLADLQANLDHYSGDAGIASGGRGGVGISPLRYGISVAGPLRPGPHGYLIFEDPGRPANQQLADGPTIGRLLATAGVLILLLNACRSAWTEAPHRPVQPNYHPEDTGSSRSGDDARLKDIHARIRAYGSLAAEVADAGVPGVAAMRYNAYVVTAAQFTADLYAHLLGGRTLGQAAAAARQALAADPARRVGGAPVALKDWTVPIVYEAAPLTLLQPKQLDMPLIQLTLPDSPDAGGVWRWWPGLSHAVGAESSWAGVRVAATATLAQALGRNGWRPMLRAKEGATSADVVG